MQETSTELYQQYKDMTQRAADLQYAAAMLEWDQEVYMPAKSTPFRGRQLATLASQAHELLTSATYNEILQELVTRKDLAEDEAANVRVSYDDMQKNNKLPISFIEELTTQTSAGYNAWLSARNANDYKIFEPHLHKMIALKRKQAELYGYDAHPYNALLDDYEKGMTVAVLDRVFDTVKRELPALLSRIQSAQQVSNSFYQQFFPKQQQWDFSISVLQKMGYDFEAGRQDYSEHPFTTSFSATDVRITTRADEHNFASMFWSSVHEGGHALYEQGLPKDQYGLPLGAAASLSIHESQSRLWENCVGRGKDFWQFFYVQLQKLFPEQLANISLDAFYKGMNKVQPSLVRTEADEITYHFHVMIRYEIEKALIEGSLNPADLPAAWNDMYEKYLGIRPADDKTGVLQDVHWSHGSFGYFPTYSLGSFYAAQFFEQAKKDISGLDHQIANGEFNQLLSWLRQHIHKHGRRYSSQELCKHITGKELDITAFVRYAEGKYKDIYTY